MMQLIFQQALVYQRMVRTARCMQLEPKRFNFRRTLARPVQKRTVFTESV
jgi:hypothetical protein